MPAGKKPDTDFSEESARQAAARRLAAWFRAEGRPLAFRRERDPYSIWVLEVMGQQTQLPRAALYLGRWLERFPDIHTLAAAPETEVLRAWEGLGYYSRARNLHRAAQLVVRDSGGRLPETREGLLALPGVGGYTAAAVASIAFGEAVPAVDANVLRIFARLLLHGGALTEAAFKSRVEAAIGAMQGVEAPGVINEALMELGEVCCLRRAPRCAVCPLAAWCRAHAAGEAERLPQRRPQAAVIREAHAVFRISDDEERVFVLPPAAAGLWPGLWTLPRAVLREAPEQGGLERLFREEYGFAIRIGALLPPVRHSYTRFRLLFHPVRARLSGGAPCEGEWVPAGTLGTLPFPSGLRKVLTRLE